MWFCKDKRNEKAESLFSGSLADINSLLDKLGKGFADLQFEKQNNAEVLERKIEEKIKDVIAVEREIDARKLNLIEPRHDKTNTWHVRPAKTQIRLGVRLV